MMMQESTELCELKHAIRMHLLIVGGPSQQLCAFLVKVVDFMEDTDSERRKREILDLAFHIVESLGIYVQQSVDSRARQAARRGRNMPEWVKRRGDEILVTIGKSRGIADKVAAKEAVLRSIAQALDGLGSFTGATYPTLFDNRGNPLNNLSSKNVVQPLSVQNED